MSRGSGPWSKISRSPGFGSSVHRAFPVASNQWQSAISVPITVAGPQRFFTAFPENYGFSLISYKN